MASGGSGRKGGTKRPRGSVEKENSPQSEVQNSLPRFQNVHSLLKNPHSTRASLAPASSPSAASARDAPATAGAAAGGGQETSPPETLLHLRKVPHFTRVYVVSTASTSTASAREAPGTGGAAAGSGQETSPPQSLLHPLTKSQSTRASLASTASSAAEERQSIRASLASTVSRSASSARGAPVTGGAALVDGEELIMVEDFSSPSSFCTPTSSGAVQQGSAVLGEELPLLEDSSVLSFLDTLTSSDAVQQGQAGGGQELPLLEASSVTSFFDTLASSGAVNQGAAGGGEGPPPPKTRLRPRPQPTLASTACTTSSTISSACEASAKRAATGGEAKGGAVGPPVLKIRLRPRTRPILASLASTASSTAASAREAPAVGGVVACSGEQTAATGREEEVYGKGSPAPRSLIRLLSQPTLASLACTTAPLAVSARKARARRRASAGGGERPQFPESLLRQVMHPVYTPASIATTTSPSAASASATGGATAGDGRESPRPQASPAPSSPSSSSCISTCSYVSSTSFFSVSSSSSSSSSTSSAAVHLGVAGGRDAKPPPQKLVRALTEPQHPRAYLANGSSTPSASGAGHQGAAVDEEERERRRETLLIQESRKLIDEAGSSPYALGEQLCHAAEQGRLSEVRRLIDYGANVNYQDKNGYTPLHKAIELKVYVDVVSLLLERGADASVGNYINGQSALHLAAIWDRSGRCVELMVSSGINVNTKCDAGITALHLAAYHGNENSVRALISANARIDLKPWHGRWRNRTPFEVATTRSIRKLLRLRSQEVHKISLGQ